MLALRIGRARPHGHCLQADHVGLARVRVAHEVGDTDAIVPVLAGQRETRDLAGGVAGRKKHEIVALAHRRPQSVDPARHQNVALGALLDQGVEYRI